MRRAWVGIAVVVLAAACGDAGETSAPTRDEPPYYTTSPPAPRDLATIAANAHDAFVFGGYTVGTHDRHALSDGWLYDFASDSWEHVPAAPFTRAPEEFPRPVAIGDDYLAFVRTCSRHDSSDYDTGCNKDGIESALFDTTTSEWHRVTPPSAFVRSLQPLGTRGRVAYFQSGALADRSVWQYRIDDDEWSQLDLPFLAYETCLAGDNLVALSVQFRNYGKLVDKNPLNLQPGQGLSMGPDDGFVLPRIARLDLAAPSSDWVVGNGAPSVSYGEQTPVVQCGATGALVTDYATGNALRYSFATATWTDVSAQLAPRLGGETDSDTADGDLMTLFSLLQQEKPPLQFDLAAGRTTAQQLPVMHANGWIVVQVGHRLIGWAASRSAKGGYLEVARVPA